MSDIHTRLADALGSHEAWQRSDRTWECACGKAFGVKVNYDHHVADVLLSLRRIAVVELPELSKNELHHQYWIWDDQRGFHFSNMGAASADEVREFAAALLAAVNSHE